MPVKSQRGRAKIAHARKSLGPIRCGPTEGGTDVTASRILVPSQIGIDLRPSPAAEDPSSTVNLDWGHVRYPKRHLDTAHFPYHRIANLKICKLLRLHDHSLGAGDEPSNSGQRRGLARLALFDGSWNSADSIRDSTLSHPLDHGSAPRSRGGFPVTGEPTALGRLNGARMPDIGQYGSGVRDQRTAKYQSMYRCFKI